MGHSDYLFKSTSFIDGAASAIDLFGDFEDYNEQSTPEEADAVAFYHDIQALKEDSDKVMALLRSRTSSRR